MIPKSCPVGFVPSDLPNDLASPVLMDRTKRLVLVTIQPQEKVPTEGLSLLLNDHYLVTTVSMGELFGMRNSDPFALAVLNDDLGASELVAAAQFVRRQWPKARILLLLGQAAISLPDNLYDDSIGQSCEQESLLETLTNLSFDPWKQRTEGRPFVIRTPR